MRPGGPVPGRSFELQDYVALPAAAGRRALAVSAVVRNARKRHDIAPAHFTADTGFNIPPAGFKLDLIEGHMKPVRADLAGPPVVVKVDLAEAGLAAFITDRCTAGLNGVAGELVYLPLGLAPFVAAIVARPRKLSR